MCVCPCVDLRTSAWTRTILTIIPYFVLRAELSHWRVIEQAAVKHVQWSQIVKAGACNSGESVDRRPRPRGVPFISNCRVSFLLLQLYQAVCELDEAAVTKALQNGANASCTDGSDEPVRAPHHLLRGSRWPLVWGCRRKKRPTWFFERLLLPSTLCLILVVVRWDGFTFIGLM